MSAIAELNTNIPDELVEEFLKRLPYISEGIRNARILPGAARVSFDLGPGFETQTDLVASRISEVADKLCMNHKPGLSKTLAKKDVLPSSFHDDPHPLLIERGDIALFGRGRYGFGPRLVGLMGYFDLRYRQMAAGFKAPAHVFPSLIGADVLDRCRYIRNFPSSLNMVSHLREDLGAIQEFARDARWDGKELACDHSSLSGVECLLSPSVCFHWYMWLRNSKLLEPGAVTAIGKCFRYESSNLTGLERLWDFTMREIIFVGPSDYVLGANRTGLGLCTAFLDDLGIAYEITSATDPFFCDSYSVQAAYQQGFDLKFELLAPLPYSGKKLAVGSINYHQDFFGRTFEIQSAESAAHTGCIAFGQERMALAFVAQHGLDERNWPETVRQGMRNGVS